MIKLHLQEILTCASPVYAFCSDSFGRVIFKGQWKRAFNGDHSLGDVEEEVEFLVEENDLVPVEDLFAFLPVEYLSVLVPRHDLEVYELGAMVQQIHFVASLIDLSACLPCADERLRIHMQQLHLAPVLHKLTPFSLQNLPVQLFLFIQFPFQLSKLLLKALLLLPLFEHVTYGPIYDNDGYQKL